MHIRRHYHGWFWDLPLCPLWHVCSNPVILTYQGECRGDSGVCVPCGMCIQPMPFLVYMYQPCYSYLSGERVEVIQVSAVVSFVACVSTFALFGAYVSTLPIRGACRGDSGVCCCVLCGMGINLCPLWRMCVNLTYQGRELRRFRCLLLCPL